MADATQDELVREAEASCSREEMMDGRVRLCLSGLEMRQRGIKAEGLMRAGWRAAVNQDLFVKFAP